METLDLIERAFASTGARIAKVTPADLSTKTPCTEWDVRALLDHTIGVVAGFVAAASRTPASDPNEHDFVGDDPSAAYDQAAKAALHAWSQPGALDGTVTLRFGELPAPVAASINVVDTLVHGWDLSKALGQDATLDPELATEALERVRAFLPADFRGPGKPFGAEVRVPADASPSDQLVAFLGRQP